jgi:hypothetical protein
VPGALPLWSHWLALTPDRAARVSQIRAGESATYWAPVADAFEESVNQPPTSTTTSAEPLKL